MGDLKLSDFDFMGIIEVDKEEIDMRLKELLTPTNNDTYLSRSTLFWKQYSCVEAKKFRDELIRFLIKVKPKGKNAFIVLDYMANFSGKLYYKLCEDFIKSQCSLEMLNQAKYCLLNDVKNIVSLLEQNKYGLEFNSLPYVQGNIPERNIECNNMALLYLFTKSLIPPTDYNILNTGLGSVFTGPFFQCIHNINWTIC